MSVVGLDRAPVPGWLSGLVERCEAGGPVFSRFPIPEQGGRASAVLILFGPWDQGPGEDVLLIERAEGMRNHAGQPAFPGGAIDPEDADAVAAALREATEETGVDPADVDVLADLPPLWLPAGEFEVTPVLGWWARPGAVAPGHPAEVRAVLRVPLAELLDPANRLRVRHPRGFVGPAFAVRGLLVWGFTAVLLDALLDLAGLTRDWDHDHVEDLPPRALGQPVPP